MGHHVHLRAPAPHLPPPVSDAMRRDLFGAFASMLLLVPSEAGVDKAVELDGDLIAMCTGFVRLEDEHEVACRAEDHAPDGPDKDRLLDRVELLADQRSELYTAICGMPARTPEGLRAKAEALSSWVLKASDGTAWRSEDQLTLSLVRDIAGRA